MGYKKDVIKGVSWAGMLSFFTKAVGFLETIVLARILVPSQFGAYGIALLALGLLETITQTGVNIILVQEKEINPYISSAWLVSIVRGFIITALLFFSSPLIANFFHSTDSLLLLRLISLAPFLRGFINPAVVMFQKDLLFRKYFWYQVVILFVDTVTSIIITLITKQPIGIVIGLLAGVFIELLLSFFVISPRPSFDFRKDYALKIFHGGKWVTGSAIFDYLFFNSDNIAVGRILGAGSLGVYQLGYSLAVMPLVEIGNVLNFVTFPVFTKIREDRIRLKSAYIKMILSVGLLTIPFVIIFVFVPQLFIFILGKKWIAIASVLPILSILGFVKAISNATSALFLSEVKQKYAMVITLATIIGMLATLVPLIHHYGIVGAAMAALIGSLVALPLFCYFLWRLLCKDA